MLLSDFTLKKRNQDVSIDLAINLIKLEFQTQSLKYIELNILFQWNIRYKSLESVL